MSDLCRLIWCALIALFRSRVALEAEILVLLQQLNVLRRKSSKRLALSNVDRLLFAGLYSGARGVLDVLKILNPENQNVVVEYACSAQYDPPIDGRTYCPDALYIIDDLVGNRRRIGGRQDRLGISKAEVIVAAARHE